MRKSFWTVAAAVIAFSGAIITGPAFAAASNFTLVNATDRSMADVSIRRFGAQDWRPLGVAPGAGARARVNFSDPDCAFDIRAQLSGGITAIWSGVNLCEVNAVILHREQSGELWVDYE